MLKVQIQIVTWNSKPYLERLFLGINRQQGVDFSARGGPAFGWNVIVIDNASNDGTVEWIEERFSVIPAKAGIQESSATNPGSRVKPGMTIKLIRNNENRGFAAAHNQGFAVCEAPYVLVLNPDTELQAGYLEEVLRIMEGTVPLTLTLSQRERGLPGASIAAVQGKLYRQLPEGEKYGIIDSCGLKMKPYGQVVDIGQNQPDKGNFEAQGEVFGATGACAFYRLEALHQVADKHGIFDERFGSYKEDVDLAWRLNKAGWKAVFTPKATAWHGRRVGRGDSRSLRIRFLSLRNHLLMLLKNVKVQNPNAKSRSND